ELAGEQPHHHLVCQECDNSLEIPHTILSQLYSQIEEEYRFTIDMNHISFFGLCELCRESQ
ncbi:hypothetical protein MNBD_CHLOROFLEXI01-2422, partial [hydrothermal vent metagenome]